MTHNECIVGPAARGGWIVRLSAREAGPYASRDIALRVAVVEALHLQRANRAARIIVRNSRGAICAEYNLHQSSRNTQAFVSRATETLNGRLQLGPGSELLSRPEMAGSFPQLWLLISALGRHLSIWLAVPR